MKKTHTSTDISTFEINKRIKQLEATLSDLQSHVSKWYNELTYSQLVHFIALIEAFQTELEQFKTTNLGLPLVYHLFEDYNS